LEAQLGADIALSVEPSFVPEHGVPVVEGSRDEPALFAAVYGQHRDAVYRYIRSKVGSNDDALDICQQAFTRAYERLDRYRPEKGSMASWLFAIARNAVSDHYRRRRDVPRLDWEPTALDDVELETLTVLEVERLRGVVSALPEDKQDLLALRFSGGLSIPEIAAATDRKPDAVYKQLSRTLEQLRGALDDPDR